VRDYPPPLRIKNKNKKKVPDGAKNHLKKVLWYSRRVVTKPSPFCIKKKTKKTKKTKKNKKESPRASFV
jgi:hypothetical protein